MNLDLERRKRDLLAVNADETLFAASAVGYDAVGLNFAILHKARSGKACPHLLPIVA